MEINKKCRSCGKQFIAKTFKTKYCSQRCNMIHYRLKKKQLKIVNESKLLLQQKDIVPYETQLSIIKAKDIIGIKDVMLLLGVSRSSVYRLIKNEYLKSIKFGSRILIRKKDLQNLIDHHIDKSYSKGIILKTNEELYINEYFCMNEIANYYNFTIRSIERSLITNKVKKIKKGKFVYVSKYDVIKLFGKPTKTPIKNG